MIAADLLLRPAFWPLLLAAPLAWVALRALDRARSRRLAALVGPRVGTLAPDDDRSRAIRRVAFSLALLLALLATMHPVFGAPVGEVTVGSRDLVVALDVSRSMLARDVAPDRLSRAKAAIRALAERAKGDRMGLVVFAGEARVVVPLTEDLDTLVGMAAVADPESVSRGGTDLGAAIDVALSLLPESSEAGGAVFLVTDGEDLSGRGLAAASRARARGVPVHTVALGTAGGGKIAVERGGREAFLVDKSGREVVTAADPSGLSRLAAASGGSFSDATADADALVSLYESRVLPMSRAFSESKARLLREDRYQWPLLLAFLLFLFDVALAGRGFRPAVATVAVAVAATACGGGGAAEDAEARATFLRGNRAYALSLQAEAESLRPGGDPTAAEAARSLTEDALAAWRMAAATRRDWPEARRNVERALLRLDLLRERAKDGGKPRPEPDSQPPPPPPPVPGRDTNPVEAPTVLETGDLPTADVMKVLDVLKEKEKARRETRRAEREARGGGVERDW